MFSKIVPMQSLIKDRDNFWLGGPDQDLYFDT